MSIFGQAGLGKSRISWEIHKYIDGVVEKFPWHQARSPAYGEGLAFWALAEMVRSRAEIAQGDSPAVARRRLTACLATYVPDETERRWMAPHLAGLIGVGPAPGGEREEAFAAWRAFFERISDTAPRSWSSTTSTGPTPACSTSSSTSSRARAAGRSS